MYNPETMGSTVGIRHLLFALLVAVFISFYPQLDAAGYCGDGCPEVSYQAQGAAGSGLHGVSLVVAALVLVSAVLSARTFGLPALSPGPGAFVGMAFPPEVPPPRPPA